MHAVVVAMHRKEGTPGEEFAPHDRDVHLPITQRLPDVRPSDGFGRVRVPRRLGGRR